MTTNSRKEPRPVTPAPAADSGPATGVIAATDDRPVSRLRRIVGVVGVQNISLIIAIALVVTIIGVQNPLFFTVPNLKVIGTAIAIMGLLAVVQTVVIILGALDI